MDRWEVQKADSSWNKCKSNYDIGALIDINNHHLAALRLENSWVAPLAMTIN